MSAPNKLTERAAGFANQAAEAAGPMLERAKIVAGELAEKVGPYAGRAAEKVGPYAERAAGIAAHGLSVAAGQLDKATSGKYSDKITTVSSKIEGTLNRGKR